MYEKEGGETQKRLEWTVGSEKNIHHNKQMDEKRLAPPTTALKLDGRGRTRVGKIQATGCLRLGQKSPPPPNWRRGGHQDAGRGSPLCQGPTPTARLPVKAIFWTPGCRTSASPAVTEGSRTVDRKNDWLQSQQKTQNVKKIERGRNTAIGISTKIFLRFREKKGGKH